jgi:hypothetical protein
MGQVNFYGGMGGRLDGYAHPTCKAATLSGGFFVFLSILSSTPVKIAGCFPFRIRFVEVSLMESNIFT